MDLDIEKIETVALESMKILAQISDQELKPIVLSASISLIGNSTWIEYDTEGKLVLKDQSDEQWLLQKQSSKHKLLELTALNSSLKI